MFPKPDQMRVINKAFQSLSFRGKRGYPSDLLTKPLKHQPNTRVDTDSMTRKEQNITPIKQKTYGAILRIKSDIQERDLYALVQGSYTGKWSFPKGHSNEGERPIECTLREVAEETGIDELPEPTEYLQVGYGNYFVFNLDEPIALIPRDTHEIMDTKWVTLDEMERMSLNADASLYRKKLMSGTQPFEPVTNGKKLKGSSTV
jgi:8-oxo-dGTP pyrophosphatase MutT (NUDIX family)